MSSDSEQLFTFFEKWNQFISLNIAIENGNDRLKDEAKELKSECVKLYSKFSNGEINVEKLKSSLMKFMFYEFTLGSMVCDWREPIPPYDLMGWLVILNKCPHLDKTFTTEMFLEGKYLEKVSNPLKSDPCGCLMKGSCSSHLSILGFMFNHTKLTWQDFDKENMFFTPEEIAKRDEADRKDLCEEED